MPKTDRDYIHMKIRNEKGASSVLVMLILIVLVSLGLAALTTSLASMRLGDKSAEWHMAYYELDRMAEKRVAAIDDAISDARASAETYMVSRLYLRDRTDLSDELQEDIRNIAGSSDMLTAEQKDLIGDTVFFFYIKKIISGKGVGTVRNDPDTGLYVTGFTEGPLEGSGMILEVQLMINGLKDKDRYTVTRWAVNNDY